MPDAEPDRLEVDNHDIDLLDKKIDYLYQSIQDTQNTIRFLDAKASAVLVVHGILIAATVSATQRLLTVFLQDWVGALFFWSHFLVIICQAVSICFVILCVRGRTNPVDNIDTEGLDLRKTFFDQAPSWEDKTLEVSLGKNPRWQTEGRDQLEKINALDRAGIIKELVGEQLKVSFIRARKHSKIKLAFNWLAAGLVLLFLWTVSLSVYAYYPKTGIVVLVLLWILALVYLFRKGLLR